MNLTKNQIVILGTAGVIFVLLILILTGILPGLKKRDPRLGIKTDLEFWGIFDKADAYQGAIAAFQKTYPGVTVNYRGFTNVAEYESALLDALAAGRGPDIFMIRSSALSREINKIVPVPSTKFSLLDLRNLFPRVVEADFTQKGAIFALPLSIDTLALFYNQDHFDQKAITSPPKTWEEFEAVIPKLKGIATDQAPDLLSLLMLQAGTRMISEDGSRATFASREGEDAFNFYTKFAWPNFRGALDAFSREDISIIFEYARGRERIKAKNPFLNFRISDIPQPKQAEKAIAYSNYWGYSVARQSRKQNLAWDFILTLTTNKDVARSYLTLTENPPALRSLINENLATPQLDVFARQALIARSWPQVEPNAISQIFSEMISSVISGNTEIKDALQKAEQEVTRLMERRL